MINDSKKVMVSIAMVMVLSCAFTMVPSAEAASLKYNTEWGKLYSTPNVQNSYGRCWYGTNGPIQKYYICMDSYYTQGSSANVTYDYYASSKAKNNNKVSTVKRSASSASGDSSAGYAGKGIRKKVVLYAAARGISCSRTYKY